MLLMNEINQQTYRKYKAQNYSALADYNTSPDHALMKRPSVLYVFELGHVFDMLIEDHIKGTDLFSQSYFVSEINRMPDQLLEWIAAGYDLTTKYKVNKDGSPNKTYKNHHAWLDLCLDNPGKKPIAQDDFKTMKILADNMMKIQLFGSTVGDILQHCEFQVPILWDDDGILKKGLLDAVLLLDNETFVFDFKTTATLGHFRNFLRRKYWIQDLHYTRGCSICFQPCHPMIFLVASKEAPHLCQPFQINDQSREYAYQKYDTLCQMYHAWEAQGKPAYGWLPLEEIKLYLS